MIVLDRDLRAHLLTMLALLTIERLELLELVDEARLLLGLTLSVSPRRRQHLYLFVLNNLAVFYNICHVGRGGLLHILPLGLDAEA